MSANVNKNRPNPSRVTALDSPGALPDRAAALASLRSQAAQDGARVFGEGNPAAALMLVGEAPGKAEDETGRPFVGAAGIVLNRLLERLSIPRNELWITNVVKIRPTTMGAGGAVNRAPLAGEVAAFRDILEREIDLVHPRVILCLGAVAASALIHPNFRIRDERGRWFPSPVGGKIGATYHPSYLLRLRGPEYESARDQMLADLSTAWGDALSDGTPSR